MRFERNDINVVYCCGNMEKANRLNIIGWRADKYNPDHAIVFVNGAGMPLFYCPYCGDKIDTEVK